MTRLPLDLERAYISDVPHSRENAEPGSGADEWGNDKVVICTTADRILLVCKDRSQEWAYQYTSCEQLVNISFMRELVFHFMIFNA